MSWKKHAFFAEWYCVACSTFLQHFESESLVTGGIVLGFWLAANDFIVDLLKKKKVWKWFQWNHSFVLLLFWCCCELHLDWFWKLYLYCYFYSYPLWCERAFSVWTLLCNLGVKQMETHLFNNRMLKHTWFLRSTSCTLQVQWCTRLVTEQVYYITAINMQLLVWCKHQNVLVYKLCTIKKEFVFNEKCSKMYLMFCTNVVT